MTVRILKAAKIMAVAPLLVLAGCDNEPTDANVQQAMNDLATTAFGGMFTVSKIVDRKCAAESGGGYVCQGTLVQQFRGGSQKTIPFSAVLKKGGSGWIAELR